MKLLRDSTADKIRERVIDRSPGTDSPGSEKPTLGRRPVLVRCTSATAASNSGVGAQCYPGVIIDAKASDTTQDELGTVWLTVLGNGALPLKPQSGGVYECLLAGNVEAASSDSRPRAFAAAGEAAKPSSDCGRFGALIRRGSCFTLVQVDASGLCACVVNADSIPLAWDDDYEGAIGPADSPLHGCSPGEVTTRCPSGTARRYTIPVSGFTGDCTFLNGTWTFTYDHSTGTSDYYTATFGGTTGTLVIAAGSATLTLDPDGMAATFILGSAPSCSGDITLDYDSSGCGGSHPSSLTASPASGIGAGVAYIPVLDRCTTTCEGRKPRLRLRPLGGSGSREIVCEPAGCGVDANGKPFMEFTSDDPLLCTGTFSECGENVVRFRVACAACPCPTCPEEDAVEWTAAGWYKVSGSLTGCCTYFATAESVPEGAVLCSGPYDLLDICNEYNLIESCCPDPILVPQNLCLVVSSGTCGYSVTRIAAYRGRFIIAGQVTLLWGTYATPDEPPREPTPDDYGVSATCIPSSSPSPSQWYLNAGIGAADSLICGIIQAPAIVNCGADLFPFSSSARVDILTGECYAGCHNGDTVNFAVSDAALGCEASPAASFNITDPDACTCTDPGDGTGEFATEVECVEACGGSGGGGGGGGSFDPSTLNGLTGTIVFPSGRPCGPMTISGTWSYNAVSGNATMTATGTGGCTGVAFQVTAYGSGGFELSSFFGLLHGTLISTGPPIVLAFDNTGGGGEMSGSGTITVTSS